MMMKRMRLQMLGEVDPGRNVIGDPNAGIFCEGSKETRETWYPDGCGDFPKRDEKGKQWWSALMASLAIEAKAE
jgi:hypothetical protein